LPSPKLFEHAVAVTHDGIRVLTLRPDEARPSHDAKALLDAACAVSFLPFRAGAGGGACSD
jgi:hypothetical protein